MKERKEHGKERRRKKRAIQERTWQRAEETTIDGRAIAEAVSRWLLTAAARV
jgi:hypothetical protein